MFDPTITAYFSLEAGAYVALRNHFVHTPGETLNRVEDPEMNIKPEGR